jgi:hypothetical protein
MMDSIWTATDAPEDVEATLASLDGIEAEDAFAAALWRELREAARGGAKGYNPPHDGSF